MVQTFLLSVTLNAVLCAQYSLKPGNICSMKIPTPPRRGICQNSKSKLFKLPINSLVLFKMWLNSLIHLNYPRGRCRDMPHSCDWRPQRWLQTLQTAALPPWEWLCTFVPLSSIWQCLETFGVATTDLGEEKVVTGMHLVDRGWGCCWPPHNTQDRSHSPLLQQRQRLIRPKWQQWQREALVLYPL